MKYIAGLILFFISSLSFACKGKQECPTWQEMGIEFEITNTLEKPYYKCMLLHVSGPQYYKLKDLDQLEIHLRLEDPVTGVNYLTTFINTSYDLKEKRHSGAICINPNIEHDISLEIMYTNKLGNHPKTISVKALEVQKMVQSYNDAEKILDDKKLKL